MGEKISTPIDRDMLFKTMSELEIPSKLQQLTKMILKITENQVRLPEVRDAHGVLMF